MKIVHQNIYFLSLHNEPVYHALMAGFTNEVNFGLKH